MRKESNESIGPGIGRKTKKRIMQIDSDTEDSIIIEHDKHKKLLCMKDTPLKIVTGKEQNTGENSAESSKTSNKNVMRFSDSDDDQNDESNDADKTTPLQYDGSDSGGESDANSTDDEGPDEDQMVMSRATRMSIMGIIPKDNESDDSDYIQSDDVSSLDFF